MNQRVVESNQEDQKRKQQPEGYIIKDIRNLFKLIEENDVIKDRIIRDIRNLFEKEENCLKPLRVGNFYSNNYNECESSGDRNKTLLIKEYLDQIRAYLKDIIIKLKKCNTSKIQLKLAVNFMSSKDTDEVRIMY